MITRTATKDHKANKCTDIICDTQMQSNTEFSMVSLYTREFSP